MKFCKYLFAVMVITATLAATSVLAKNKRVPKIYAFGIAASFNDSTVYFTDIQEIDSVWINDKTKFVLERENYSGQLRKYLNENGLPHRTCIISYAFKRKDIEKKYHKIRNKYVKDGKYNINNISGSDFSFTSIVPVEVEETH